MKNEQLDDYEYQERAAIRQFEANAELFEANQLALIDIRDRVPLDKARRQIAEAAEAIKRAKRQQQSNPSQETIEELRRQRELARKAWMREDDPKQQAQLKAKWLDLCTQIIELRKGM